MASLRVLRRPVAPYLELEWTSEGNRPLEVPDIPAQAPCTAKHSTSGPTKLQPEHTQLEPYSIRVAPSSLREGYKNAKALPRLALDT